MDELIFIGISLKDMLLNLGYIAPILSCLFIMLESFIPILPLFIFVTVNFMILGNFFGFLVSYIFSVLGSYLVFKLFKNQKINTKVNLKNMSLTKLTLILSLPYTPSSLVNATAGLLDVDNKNYLIALMISKLFIILFWGFIGSNLCVNMNNINILFSLLCIMSISFIISKIFEKYI